MPRPTIEGVVVRQIDMRHKSTKSNKDYRITISEVAPDQCRVYTEHGPADHLQNGKELTSRLVSLGEANRLANNARDKKLNQRDSYDVRRDQKFAGTSAQQPSSPTTNASPARPRRPIASLSPESRGKLVAVF